MAKEKEEMKTNEQEEQEDNEQEANEEISLAEVPTKYGLVYRTPEGDMNSEQYLVWIGNLLLKIKQALAG